ncbi:MAG: hypothetical protein ACRDNZ_01270 [Streptosporangiaceae bacterium]
MSVIRFSVVLSVVVVAVGLLIAGALSGDLLLVYLAIALAGLALLMLIVGVVAWRGEIFEWAATGDAEPATAAPAPASGSTAALTAAGVEQVRPADRVAGQSLVPAVSGGVARTSASPSVDDLLRRARQQPATATSAASTAAVTPRTAAAIPRPAATPRPAAAIPPPAVTPRPAAVSLEPPRQAPLPVMSARREPVGPAVATPVKTTPAAAEAAPAGAARPSPASPVSAASPGSPIIPPASSASSPAGTPETTSVPGGAEAPGNPDAPGTPGTPDPPDRPDVRDPAAAQVTVVPGIGRYHQADCILIRFLDVADLDVMTRQAAQAAGCVPCKACRPE